MQKMLSNLLLVCIVLSSFSINVKTQNPPNNIHLLGDDYYYSNQSPENKWNHYKNRFKKIYASPEEDERNKRTFIERLTIIERHNIDFANGLKDFKMSVNNQTDQSYSQFQNRLGIVRYQVSKLRKQASTYFSKNNEKILFPLHYLEVPPFVDWRSHGFVTPVRNQGDCGSCWAFSVAAALESHQLRIGKLNSNTSSWLSTQELVDCDEFNYGCNGGTFEEAFNYVVKNKWLNKDQIYPYRAVQNVRCLKKNIHYEYFLDGYVVNGEGDEHELEKLVAFWGPVTAAIDVTESMMMYGSGVYSDYDCSKRNINHAVTIVGYGQERGLPYWLVKNSWGNDFGEEGYIKILRGVNMCGISSINMMPIIKLSK